MVGISQGAQAIEGEKTDLEAVWEILQKGMPIKEVLWWKNQGIPWA